MVGTEAVLCGRIGKKTESRSAAGGRHRSAAYGRGADAAEVASRVVTADLDRPSRRADLRRSVALFRAFRVEQSDPDRFYRMLADDSVEQLESFVDLAGQTVLDVGGGPGYFATAFRSRGARYLTVESSVGELAALSVPTPGSVLGDAQAIPFRSGAVDVCYSSNVLEHVPRPWRMATEMIRVTRPRGLVFISFTNWLGPWGGHETSPWHYVGGHRAAGRYERRHGRQPKNVFGESLFAVSVGDALRWARNAPDVHLLAAFPRYHPRWACPIVRLPGIREIGTWNLVMVLRRT
jgi:SAM-dependent methyltransferase